MLAFDSFSHLTFDCYGTLIDWERGILAALRPILSAHGQRLTDNLVLELYGELESEAERGPYRTYREVLTTVIDGIGLRLGFAPAPAERDALAASVQDWPPFPDTVASLQALSQQFKLVILSNIDDDLFAGSARHLQVRFTEVITAQQVGSYKPDPRNFRYALERLGVASDQVLHVAQSLYHDIVPARSLGLATVWVNRRHDRLGYGATPPAMETPDLEVPDLATLAQLATAARTRSGEGATG